MKKVKTQKVSRRVQLALARKRRVARENKAFEKLTPAQKRVAIARDVLAQIEMKKFVPVNGTWLTDYNDAEEELFSLKDVKDNKELRDVLNKKETCTGCALGGLFMCAVKRVDALKIHDLVAVKEAKEAVKNSYTTYGSNIDNHLHEGKSIDMGDIIKYFAKIKLFSKQQSELIELAFENGGGGFDAEEVENGAAAEDFFFIRDKQNDQVLHRIENPTDRMRLIMENIILNKGTFNPNQKPVRVISFVTPNFDKAA